MVRALLFFSAKSSNLGFWDPWTHQWDLNRTAILAQIWGLFTAQVYPDNKCCPLPGWFLLPLLLEATIKLGEGERKCAVD